jgi:Fe2+ transport system protein FeoA
VSHSPTLPLDGIDEGETVELVAVRTLGPSALRLVELGLSPRTEITVLKAARGQPLIIRVRDSRLAIDRQTARHIRVRRLQKRRRREHRRRPPRGWRRASASRKGRRNRHRRFAELFRTWFQGQPQAGKGRRRAKRKKKNAAK